VPFVPEAGVPLPNVARHRAWRERGVERFRHQDDLLGSIASALEAPERSSFPPAGLLAAWRSTHDAPAALLVLLRARRLEEVARALRLTSAQLEDEGCDFLDDEGWLGVSLRLGAYHHASAFTNLPAAWSALSSPFGHDYLTARVQHTMLGAIRRVVPEPPALEAFVGHDPDGLGGLDDGTPALRLAYDAAVDSTMMEVRFLEPWGPVTNPRGLEEELAREVGEGHRLSGRKLRAVARRSDCDDVLFVGDNLAAVVHLTWTNETSPDRPAAEIFPSMREWAARRMEPDHEELTGGTPRSVAFRFRSALTMPEMLDRLPEKERWEWTLRESAWYGEYLWAKDGPTRVRIFADETPGVFTMQADLVDTDDPVESWLPTASALATVVFLPTIDAVEIAASPPQRD